MFYTHDGGVTWDEKPLFPFIVVDRSLGLQVPQLPALGGITPPSITLLINPPDRSEISYPSVSFVGYTPSMPSMRNVDLSQRADTGNARAPYTYGRPVFPEYISPFFVPPPGLTGDLLSAVDGSASGRRPARTRT